MLQYAKDSLARDGKFGVVISHDVQFQDIAAGMGFAATTDNEADAVFYTDKGSTDYQLPPGFKITSMAETFDLYQYKRVLRRGFNHELNGEGELQFTPEVEEQAREHMLRPNVDLDLK